MSKRTCVECVCAQSLSHVWLFPTLWTLAQQAPVSMGFSRQEYVSGLPFPPLGGSSWPRDQTCISYIGGWILYHWATWEALQCQNNNDQNRIISPWTWDGLLVLHSRKYFLFKNPLAYLCILSYSCPALPFVHTNFSSWWQGEIFNWKVNNCRHVEEIDYEKWSKTAENSVSHKNFMWIPSALAFCAPGRYNLEQFGWLNKSSGTN